MMTISTLLKRVIIMKKLLILAALSLTATFVLADEIQPYDGSAAYINLNAGWATQQFTPTGGFAATLNAGYNFNRAFALEGGYTNIASSEFGATQTNNIFDVAAKGTLALSEAFALYGRLGVGINTMSWGGTSNVGTPSWYCNSNSATNFIGLAGLGGSFALTRHFDLRVEDTLYIPMGGGNATTGQINAVLGGVQYNF